MPVMTHGYFGSAGVGNLLATPQLFAVQKNHSYILPNQFKREKIPAFAAFYMHLQWFLIS